MQSDIHFAPDALKKMNPKIVQMLMGHQHYSTTIEIYTHVTQMNFDKEVQKFGHAV